MTEKTQLNPNTADAEALQTIPGIGPTTAERIIAARPFSEPEDLLRVSGVSASFLDKIRDRLSFETADEPEADIEAETPPEEEAGATDEAPEEAAFTAEEIAAEETAGEEPAEEELPDEEPLPEEPEAPQPPVPQEEMPRPAEKQPRYITRGQAFWMSATAAFFAFVFAAALTLSLLSALNRGLRFATPGDVRTVQNEVGDLQGQLETVSSDVSGLRTRMDNFEALGGRIDNLETEVNALQTDLDSVSGEVESLGTEIDSLSGTVDELVSSSSRFQDFLDGLAELLSGLAPEGSK